jgi:hypothetical protein
MKKRITNVDTLSALFDRLITENIKLYFFDKEKLKKRISELFEICLTEHNYNYVSEKRTFDENSITEELEQLITNDINIGESDRERLKLAMMNEKRLRKANEGRARNKNNIDMKFEKIVSDK